MPYVSWWLNKINQIDRNIGHIDHLQKRLNHLTDYFVEATIFLNASASNLLSLIPS